MKISRKNQNYLVDVLKFCKTLDCVSIYLFKNRLPLMDHQYIVAVKKDADTMCFQHFKDINKAISCYLENVCLYA